MHKVLFVCMGNICRSPTAHGIFQTMVNKKNLQEMFLIDSAGTHSYHNGRPADFRSSETASKYGVDLSEIRSRKIEEHDFEIFDYIIAMDNSNVANLLQICPKPYQSKIKLMLDFLPNEEVSEVPDPYYSDDGFEEVFDLINRSCEKLLSKINHAL